MKMPGFTAEASLLKPQVPARYKATSADMTSTMVILPQATRAERDYCEKEYPYGRVKSVTGPCTGGRVGKSWVYSPVDPYPYYSYWHLCEGYWTYAWIEYCDRKGYTISRGCGLCLW